ncbi:MAG: hypothetical protein O3B87_05920 [bacterium]|nr:hypothetical protein [bacterium]
MLLYSQLRPDFLGQIQQIVQQDFREPISVVKESTPWLNHLFDRFLHHEADGVISIGSGSGIELVDLRVKYPKAHIIGIDSYTQYGDPELKARHMNNALLFAMYCGAQLIPNDISLCNAKKILSRYSSPLVIARNVGPLDSNDTSLLEALPLWANEVTANGATMMVTALSPLDAALTHRAFIRAGVPFSHNIYDQGSTILQKGSPEDSQFAVHAVDLGIEAEYNYYYHSAQLLSQSDSHVFMIGQ